MNINDFTIHCTEEQTRKALKMGVQMETVGIKDYRPAVQNGFAWAIIPSAEQMIGFILDSDKGYAVDLATLIKEYGYKQGCLTFIDNYLK